MSKRNWDLIRRQKIGSAIERTLVSNPPPNPVIETTTTLVYSCEWNDGLIMGVLKLSDGHQIFARYDRTGKRWVGYVQPWQLERIADQWERVLVEHEDGKEPVENQ